MFKPLDLAVVLAYLVLMAVLGLWQAAKIRSAGDYFAGGRTFNKFFMMMHALGTGTHADDPVGVVGASFERGISGIWYTYVYLFATPFYWLIAPLFRRSRYLTMADFFEDRYSRGLGLMYTIMGVLIFAINTGTLLKGTELITSAMTQGAVPGWASILVMTLVFVAYGTAGGLMATVVVEGIQGLLIIVMSLLLVPFGLAAVGGFHGMRAVLTPSHFSLAAPQEVTWVWVLSASLAMLIGIVAQPHIMEVCASGKTEFEGRVGFTYGNYVKRFCALGWAVVGVIVAAMVAQGKIPALGGHRELAFGTAIRTLLPTGFVGLMFAAILAAQMSTLSAFMVAGSALLSRNLYQRYWLPAEPAEGTEQKVLRFGRFAGLIVVGLGVGFAFLVGGVTDALAWFWALNALLGVLVWAAVLWKPANSVGAWTAFGWMALIWLVVGPIGAKLGGGHVWWLGCYADKANLHWLLLTYLPPGVVALVVGSLCSDFEREPMHGVAIGTGFVLLGLALVYWLPATGYLMILASVLGLMLGGANRRERDNSGAERFYRLMATPVGREQELVDAGIEAVYAGQSEGHPWELNHPKLVQIGGFAVACCFTLVVLGLLYWIAGLGR